MEYNNRLIGEKSPYLLQHAHNPVNWLPWGEEAFARARAEDRPVFLSIGYSTCRWCHIMEREVFEDQECARILNEHVVSVKVDREERPDLDQLYMAAVHLLAGSGGWPLSAFLLPDGRPFCGGTYFPPGQFKRLVVQVGEAYRQRRTQVEQAADEVARRVSQSFAPATREEQLRPALVWHAVSVLLNQFDDENGGFGGAPKFPPHGALSLICHLLCQEKRPELLTVLTETLEAIALGGIYDHVGGGFHRYSTDAAWFLPHFEKMLYDNALLFRSYVDGYLLTGDAFYRQVADGIHQWVEREMTTPEGAFCTGLDAESEGEEGKFYLWRRSDVIHLLGEEAGKRFCRVYQITEEGNYSEEHRGLGRTGANVPHVRRRLSALAETEGLSPAALEAEMARARAGLLEARQRRARPFRDDKVITAWNGLMIGSLAYAGRHLENSGYTLTACRAAEFVLSHCRPAAGGLRRRWRDGEAGRQVFLDDYAFLIQGLLELHETTGERTWLASAEALTREMLANFTDRDQGDFFFTPDDAEPLFARPKELFDQPVPASSAVAAEALLHLSTLTQDRRYREAAERALLALSPWVLQLAQGAASVARALAICLGFPALSS